MGSYIGKADHTYSLIMRLHHNVVKTAVRTISLAYSRITFAHIASKLLLDSPEDAEFIVAKVSSCSPCALVHTGVTVIHSNVLITSITTCSTYGKQDVVTYFLERKHTCDDCNQGCSSDIKKIQ